MLTRGPVSERGRPFRLWLGRVDRNGRVF